MTTVSTKHIPQPTGDPALSIHGAKGTILDDMELIRKLCLPEKTDNKHRNASNISFGRGAAGPLQTTKQADFGLPSMADVEPKTTRDARSRYMNTKHFDLGFDAPPMVTQNRATMMPPGRADLVGTSRNHMIGGPNDKNRSNIFSSDKDREDWLNNLRSTNQDAYRPAPGDVRDPKNKEIIRQLRAHHFGFGNDPVDYLSHHNAAFPQPTSPPQLPRALRPGPTAVQLGAADYDWAKDLQTTHKSAYKTPVQRPEDALDVFLRDQPPLSFGEDKREMMTTYKGSYKNVGYLDCNNLTDDQLRLLGVTREEIIPRKVPLPFMTQAFKNSLDQPVS